MTPVLYKSYYTVALCGQVYSLTDFVGFFVPQMRILCALITIQLKMGFTRTE